MIYLADKKNRKQRSRKISQLVGKAPGSLNYIGDNSSVKGSVSITIGTKASGFIKTEVSISEIKTFESEIDKYDLIWVNLTGLSNVEMLSQIGESFGINKLNLEDILNIYQRPKIEDTGNGLFAEVNRLTFNSERKVDSYQISFFLHRNFLLTFQDFEEDFYSHVHLRLPETLTFSGNPVEYLFYMILDLIVDEYFVVSEKINEVIENIEEEILTGDNQKKIYELQSIQRDLRTLRAAVWPLREMFSKLFKKETKFVSDEIQFFLNDINDHINQISEILEGLRETCLALIDLNMNAISNRLNDIMKLLTIISTIFMPLSFLAGVYGMNFKYMPELQFWWAYPLLLGIMIICGVSFLIYFKRKGWFK